MILYYIDDTMFQDTTFASQILYRFERYIEHHPCDVIAISIASDERIQIAQVNALAKHCMFLMSPSLFDIEGVQGNLHTSFLSINGFQTMQSYSGSFVKYDMDLMICERVYLDMFVSHNLDLEWLIEDITHMVKEKLHAIKKKKIMN